MPNAIKNGSESKEKAPFPEGNGAFGSPTRIRNLDKTESESVVLPLHNRTITCCKIYACILIFKKLLGILP